ncbi:phospholipase A2 inhibitor NAI-like [Leptodactylus fuscus]|uniref:phospholipase A2 inhibitor NAI-like n=1 Tax=Leptodactylus fuscus TaxID=238119 RepID=UPI003F4EF410
MDLWRFWFFFSACAATGYCLQCIFCYEVISDSCNTANTETCLDGQVCIYQVTSSIRNGVISRYIRRACAPKSECNVSGTFTYYNTTERVATTCCSNDSCTPTIPIIPPVNAKEPNGVTCTKCSLPGPLCTYVENMECSGMETKCLLVSTKQTTGTQTQLTILRGCATSGYCTRNNVNFTMCQPS